jgi:hypothetical protein
MADEVAKLRRRVRQLERARQRWKIRVADKQQEVRYLRVKARDLTRSRDAWKQRASAAGPPTPRPDEPPVLLPLPREGPDAGGLAPLAGATPVTDPGEAPARPAPPGCCPSWPETRRAPTATGTPA